MSQDPKELAKQLRKPEGDEGIKVASNLNTSNVHITSYTYDCMNVASGERILEIGFGNGKLMPLLFERAPDIYLAGIDFSSTMVEEATRYLDDHIKRQRMEIKLGATSAIPYREGTFDKVCSINTLYFWDAPLEDAREVLRVLKPGGQVYIGIRPKEEVKNLEFTKHGFTLYDPEEAVDLLIRAGFSEAYFITRKDPPLTFNDKTYTLTSCCIVGKKHNG
jgi:ubiquinone/menaquinone biosynthesis C-methylase UbiE